MMSHDAIYSLSRALSTAATALEDIEQRGGALSKRLAADALAEVNKHLATTQTILGIAPE